MHGAGAFGVAPLDPALLADPLAFLAAELRRQRAWLGHLARLVPVTRDTRLLAGALLHWLTRELPAQEAAEAALLYPRLRPRDGAGLIPRLLEDQSRARSLAEPVVAGLRALSARRPPGPGFATAVTGFVEAQRRRIALQEDAVMPLATATLDAGARRDLAQEMAARWGLGGPAG